MARTKFVKAKQHHIEAMQGLFRSIDIYECMSTNDKSADETAQDGFLDGLKTWVGLLDNNPFCVFGVASKSTLSTIGVPWFLATKVLDVDKKARRAVKHSNKHYVREMLRYFDNLENYVSAYNVRSIIWLEGTGYTVGKIEPYGIHKRPFRKFYMNKRGL